MTQPDSPQAFLDLMLEHFLADQSVRVADNYDADRFSMDGIDRSESTYNWLHKEALCELVRKSEVYFAAYGLMADQASRDLYIDLLRYRLSGHKHVKLPTNNPAYHELRRQEYAVAREASPLSVSLGPNEQLARFHHRFEGKDLVFDGLTLFWPFFIRQYFFDRGGVHICVKEGDHVIDAGACLGDTALAFGAVAGGAGHVHLFELLHTHLQVCEHNLRQNAGLSRFTVHPVGLSDGVRTGGGALPQDVSPGFSIDGRDDVPTETIDHLVGAGRIERVDFIKMDIEGSELAALRGAEATLRRFKPRLAISLYHKITDLFEIPLYLDRLGLGYRFYLDHYTIHLGESVLYAHADV